MKKLIFGFTLALLLIIGCGCNASKNDRERRGFPEPVETILDRADRFELYALDPDTDERNPKSRSDGFHGCKILGKVVIPRNETRESVIEALRKGVAESDGKFLKCFDPHHGIRASYDDQTVDLVICYACSQIYVHLGTGNKKGKMVTTTAVASPVLNKVLRNAGIPLAKGAGD